MVGGVAMGECVRGVRAVRRFESERLPNVTSVVHRHDFEPTSLQELKAMLERNKSQAWLALPEWATVSRPADAAQAEAWREEADYRAAVAYWEATNGRGET